MLQWLTDDIEESKEHQPDLLRIYFSEIVNGPMGEYRTLIQSGKKQGQSYFVHVLDGISILHTLRASGIIAMNDIEEMLLFTAYTIHDINKNPLYSDRDTGSSYSSIATRENIRAELYRLHMERFFADYDQYIEDIRLLMLLHQHDAAPLEDLDHSRHAYVLRHARLVDLGTLLYAVDNLDLSHSLSLNTHLQNFVNQINPLADRRWTWTMHRLGENRGVLSNMIHNTVVTYVQQQHTMIDLLYYPDGVAYLLPEGEAFQWTSADVHAVAKHLAQAIREKQVISLDQFVTISQLGIRASSAAKESGASYHDLLYAIRKRVDRKVYAQKWLDEYNQRLLADIRSATIHTDETISTLAKRWFEKFPALIPLDQESLKCGDMLLAYRNLLHDHLRTIVKQKGSCDAWTYVYRLLNLPPENYILYEQVDHYRRHYFIALDYELPLDTLFERCLSDIAELVGEQETPDVDGREFYDYLAVQLEFQGSGTSRDFKAHLQRYQKDRNKQCCMCSSASPSGKLMDAEVPDHLGVQVFSNRIKGGGGEPKRYVCPLCRTQLILEKLTRVSFKKGKAYANFYLHLYPYAFFSAPYLNALYFTLKGVVHEGHQSFFLKRDRYYRHWRDQFEPALKQRLMSQRPPETEEREQEYLSQATIVNGISVPPFSEAVSNTPTLPLNAPGTNYAQQFLFALTHALMIADFFGCRVVLSQTPFPLLSSDYLA
jgi:CRISPR-associated protein Csc3